jgi:hypothetical protein
MICIKANDFYVIMESNHFRESKGFALNDFFMIFFYVA